MQLDIYKSTYSKDPTLNGGDMTVIATSDANAVIPYTTRLMSIANTVRYEKLYVAPSGATAEDPTEVYMFLRPDSANMDLFGVGSFDAGIFQSDIDTGLISNACMAYLTPSAEHLGDYWKNYFCIGYLGSCPPDTVLALIFADGSYELCMVSYENVDVTSPAVNGYAIGATYLSILQPRVNYAVPAFIARTNLVSTAQNSFFWMSQTCKNSVNGLKTLNIEFAI